MAIAIVATVTINVAMVAATNIEYSDFDLQYFVTHSFIEGVSKSTIVEFDATTATAKDAELIAIMEFIVKHESAEYLEKDSMIIKLSSGVEIEDPHPMEYSAKGHDATTFASAFAICVNPPLN